MARTTTQQDLYEFRLYCEQATSSQLLNIITKERQANRRLYLLTARKVLSTRAVNEAERYG